MKYKYRFEELKFEDGRKNLVIILEKPVELVATFLMSDIQGADPSYVFEAIDSVLNEKTTYEEIAGNICVVEIHKDMTQIYNNLLDDEMEDVCEIETEELRKLVEIWSVELRRFYEEN